jgi:hypothetical protein
MPELKTSLMDPNQLIHYGIEVQDNPYHPTDPMVIRKEDADEGDFVACLKSQDTDIYLDTWTPTDMDLEEYPKVIMTSSRQWDPYKVKFPGMSEMEMLELEERNISKINLSFRELENDHEDVRLNELGDNYNKPMKIFDINMFNRRIMKSKLIPSLVSEGPLAEDDILPPRTFLSGKRHSNTTAEDLSEVWNISVGQAQLTLDNTTQNHVRSAIMPLSRRYRTDRMFSPKRILGEMASDTMDPRCEGLHGDKYCQVFGNKSMFCEAYPIPSKGSCHEALKIFLKEYGAPDTIITNGSKEQTSKRTIWQSHLRKNGVTGVITHPHRPSQNPMETVTKELRKKWYRAMFRTNCPRALWNYGLPHFAKIIQLTASTAAGLEGKTPLGKLTGETPDISQYLDFGWYDCV